MKRNVPVDELLSLLSSIQGVPILVVGDLILDRYIWGAAERISPEAPVPVIEVKRTEDRPGGAANVAVNLVGLGAQVSICGLIGDDLEGKTLLAKLSEHGIRHDGVITDRERPTTVKTRVIAASQQVVRIDREIRTTPSSSLCEGLAAMVDSQVDAHKGLIVSDYAKGCISESIAKRIEMMRSAGRIGYKKRALLVDPHPEKNPLHISADIVKLNRGEAERASGMKIPTVSAASAAAKVILDRFSCSLVLLTIGDEGLMLLEKGAEPFHIPAEARQVFDVSGAGDTVAAVVSSALAVGASATLAAELGNIAAGIVVGEVGTAPITSQKIEEYLKQ